eukprot:310664-Chlamydomonas_euryale.AAC.7
MVHAGRTRAAGACQCRLAQGHSPNNMCTQNSDIQFTAATATVYRRNRPQGAHHLVERVQAARSGIVSRCVMASGTHVVNRVTGSYGPVKGMPVLSVGRGDQAVGWRCHKGAVTKGSRQPIRSQQPPVVLDVQTTTIE